MITTSKLINDIVFSLAIFGGAGARTDETGFESRGIGSKNTNTQLQNMLAFLTINHQQAETRI